MMIISIDKAFPMNQYFIIKLYQMDCLYHFTVSQYFAKFVFFANKDL